MAAPPRDNFQSCGNIRRKSQSERLARERPLPSSARGNTKDPKDLEEINMVPRETGRNDRGSFIWRLIALMTPFARTSASMTRLERRDAPYQIPLFSRRSFSTSPRRDRLNEKLP